MNVILLRANSIEGIVKADFVDYPEADVLNPREFIKNLRHADEDDIFTVIMPPGTDGMYEEIESEYGIS
jgi:hypothetical protein